MIKQAVLTMVVVQAAQAGIKYYMNGSLGPSSASSPAPAVAPSASEFAKIPGGGGGNNAVPAAGKVQAAVPVLEPLWPQGTLFDAHMYITATGSPQVNLDNPAFPSVKFEGMTFGDFTWKHEWDTEVRLPLVSLS